MRTVLVVLLFSCVVLVGCGQRGSLYLPPQAQSADAAAA